MEWLQQYKSWWEQELGEEVTMDFARLKNYNRLKKKEGGVKRQ